MTMSAPRARRWAALTALAALFSLRTVGLLPAVADDGAQVSYSLDRKRTSPSPLDGAAVDGVIYPFLTGDSGVTSVRWWLDDPEMAGAPVRTDTPSPFGFSPGSVTHATARFDTSELPVGAASLTSN